MAKRLAVLVHVITGWLLLLPVLSAQANADKWYRIELLVFDNPAGGTAEQWDALPALAYPQRTTYLVEPNHPEARRPDGRTIPAAAVPQSNSGLAAARSPVKPVSARPFATLPANQREFNSKAAKLTREGQHTILFHQAWMMPIGPKPTAIPIVLDSSGDDGHWPLLQGTVTLYVARYLYLSTNLWLNTTGDYLSSTEWRMPAPPLGPVRRHQNSTNVRPMAIPDQAPRRQTQRQALGTGTTPLPTHPSAAEQSDTSTDDLTAQTRHPELQARSEYPFRHAVTLRQTRRMRSAETHYIDHPMIAVVIKVTPLPGT